MRQSIVALLSLIALSCRTTTAPPPAPVSPPTTQASLPTTAPAKIDSFRGPYFFLSNFFLAEVEFEKLGYPSVEHAYQSAKSLSMDDRRRIAVLATPAEAKAEGHKLTLRPDWEQVKFTVMEDCLRYKFTHHPELRQALLDTGNAELIEGNDWNDRIWGVYQGQGDNRLGKLLMKIRTELRSPTTKP